jgi:hypothetical protein
MLTAVDYSRNQRARQCALNHVSGAFYALFLRNVGKTLPAIDGRAMRGLPSGFAGSKFGVPPVANHRHLLLSKKRCIGHRRKVTYGVTCRRLNIDALVTAKSGFVDFAGQSTNHILFNRRAHVEFILALAKSRTN